MASVFGEITGSEDAAWHLVLENTGPAAFCVRRFFGEFRVVWDLVRMVCAMLIN